MKRAVPLVLALVSLVLLAGCSGSIYGPFERSPESVSNVTVTHVVDGDTVDVRFPDGSTDRVRLLGVDTPEAHVENRPEEFEGVPDTDSGVACLREESHDATNFTTERLHDEAVRLVFDPLADRRDRYDRLLAYVYVGETNVNYELVEGGYARVYDSEFTESDRFYEAEAQARSEQLGVWRCAG